MWKVVLAGLALVLFAVPVGAATWTEWKTGADTSYTKCYLIPGVECFWSFDDGVTDSPLLNRGSLCPKIYWRRRGGSSPIAVPEVCDGDGTNCEIMEGCNQRTGVCGDITTNDTDWGAINVPFQFIKFNPTSGSGFIVVGCGG